MSAAALRVETWEDGAALFVKAHAGARRERIAGVHDGMLRVEVTAAPEKGKANKAIAKLIAAALGVAQTSVVVLSGATMTRKRFGVAGMPPDAVRGKLAGFVD